MERKIVAGDYVPDGSGALEGLTGAEEMLARALFRLTARRGGLPFLPSLGSRLHELGREKPADRQALCAQYVAQALEEEPELKVQWVQLRQEGERGYVVVGLSWRGEEMTARVRV